MNHSFCETILHVVIYSITIPIYTVDVDFTIASTTITFVAGQTEVLTAITAIADGIAEPSEIVTVELTNPSAGLDIDSAADTATVTITDDTGTVKICFHLFPS